jgi:hypothetical protein
MASRRCRGIALATRLVVAAATVAGATVALGVNPAAATPDVINTVAGTGTAGFSGDSGQAVQAELHQPAGIALAADRGGYLIADAVNHRVRHVAPNGIITTIDGNGTPGGLGDGGPATSASLNSPLGVAVRGDGAVLIADTGNHRVRMVSPGGVITTVAGMGYGFSGDNGPATSARLAYPYGVAVRKDNSFLIADWGNNRIRQVGTGGNISTVVGSSTSGSTGDGGPASAALLSNPTDVEVTAGGGFLITDAANNRIRRVWPSGSISTVAGTGVSGFSGDNGPATAAMITYPHSVTEMSDGGFAFTEKSNRRVRRVAPGGTITTLAGTGAGGSSGDGGPPSAATMTTPWGIAETLDGDILFADHVSNRVRRITRLSTVPSAPTGVVATVTGTSSASVSFTPGFDGDSPVTSFTVSCTLNPGGGGAVQVTGAGSPIVVAGLTPGQAYRCQVRATNMNGSSPFSGFSNTFTPGVPKAPTAVTASAPAPTTANVSFTPGANGGSPITGFTATCDSTTIASSVSQNGTASPITVGGLQGGQTYKCRVRATNANGTGPYSSYSSTFKPGVPRPPTAVSASGSSMSPTTAVVSFTPGFDGGSPVTSFLAVCTQISPGAGNTNASGASSPVAVPGLTHGATYKCRVRATNAYGSSIFSTLSAPFTL